MNLARPTRWVGQLLAICACWLPLCALAQQPSPASRRLPAAQTAAAQQPAVPAADPAASPSPSGGSADGLNPDMKLEDLVKQDVVVPALSQVVETVDRQVSTVGRTPAAVFVITPEMIKRSGARYVPEVLRMAPGISVAKIDSSTWAISARGFQGRFANKLLVQIDGRVVYSPTTFGGVFWDVQVLPLPDVERIEVIRGPGTTAWGSNAVNGVINIITKKSQDTQGALIQSGGGDQEQDFNTVRVGGRSGDTTWRAYGMQFDRNKGWSPNDIQDQWRQQRGGFRTDWTPNDQETVTFQGDIFNGYEGQQFTNTIRDPPGRATVNDELHTSGGDILLRYDLQLDDESRFIAWSYYDRLRRNFSAFAFTQDTYDIDVQYQFRPHRDHDIVAGANYRRVQDFTTGGFSFFLTPPSFATQWASVFAQDTMTWVEDKLYFTLGVRLEYNTFGRFQPEPTARILWLPSERQSCWAAISRSARNPTRFDTGVNERIHLAADTFVSVEGNPIQRAEDLVAYEIGYRAAPFDDFSWDIAAYVNDYHALQGFGAPGPPEVLLPPPNMVFLVPVPFANNTAAVTWGIELTATYEFTETWRLTGSYSWFGAAARSTEPILFGEQFTVPIIESGTPHNQLYLRSSWDLSPNAQFDLIGRYVDAVTAPQLEIPKYIEMDAVFSWRPRKNLEFSLVGQNLLNPHHLEYRDWQMGLHSTQVRRGFFGMLTWTY